MHKPKNNDDRDKRVLTFHVEEDRQRIDLEESVEVVWRLA